MNPVSRSKNDLLSLYVSPRSRLFNLEPIGIGTPFTESLTGYLSRLAEAHNVSTGVLLCKELSPLFCSTWIGRGSTKGLDGLYRKAAALNGVGRMASDWVSALQQLTMGKNLRFLTLLSWSKALPHRRLLRRASAWCPLCYRDWEDKGHIIYEPLLWCLQAVSVCPVHRVRLQTVCPHCGSARPLLTIKSWPGFCPGCGEQLSKPPSNNEQREEEHLGGLVQTAEWIGEMIASAPSLHPVPTPDNVVQALSTCVGELEQGNIAAFARRIGAPKNTVWIWQEGRVLPTMESLLRICRCVNIPPVRFLTGVFDAPSNSTGERKPRRRCRRTIRPFVPAQVRPVLEAILKDGPSPPPAMEEVSRRLGYDTRLLRRHFPSLCKAISRRYLLHIRTQASKKRDVLCNTVRQATIKLHQSGVYPSHRRIEALLPKPGEFQNKEARRTWRATLLELEGLNHAKGPGE